jgi:Flp pilus assembly protein TadD
VSVDVVRQVLRDRLARAHDCRVAGRYGEAECELRSLLRLAEPDTVEHADAAAALGMLLEALGRPAAAEEALRLAVRGYERACGPDDPRLAEPLSALGAVRQLRGDLAEAERLLRRAVTLVGPGW